MSSLLFVVAAFIKTAEGILLSKRKKGKSMAGYWEFPGGKVNKGEAPEQALCRELKEELGITVFPHDLSPLTFISIPYKTFHLFLPFYHCHQWQGTIEGREKQELAWIKFEDFATAVSHSHEILPNDLPLVAYVLQQFSADVLPKNL